MCERVLSLGLGFAMLFSIGLSAQDVLLEGYVFEAGNRGYLNVVKVVLHPKGNPEAAQTVFSNKEGYFTASVPPGKTFTLTAEKDLFHPIKQDFSTVNKNPGDKVFVKTELARQPGYMFDVTLAEARTHVDSVTDAIADAWIEIYNNTTGEEVLNLKDYPDPNFNYTFQQGNHYTLLVRKKGYFAKRLEAYVNVEGCILCFDGIASLENVTDNLTEGHEMGSLLANIELKPAMEGDKFTVENIHYEYNSAQITSAAASELNNLADILEDNPDILVELGSHTDSRGKPEYNQTLSQERAQAAVAHLILRGIDPSKIIARGYGEGELLNDCAEGADCSEAQHAENRRTEIKVLGFLGGEEKEKTLVEIKEQEKFAQLLREVTDQEQYRVQEGEELPDEMKSDLEKAKKGGERAEGEEEEKEEREEMEGREEMEEMEEREEREEMIEVEEGYTELPTAELELKQGVRAEVKDRTPAGGVGTTRMDSAEQKLMAQYTVYSKTEERANSISPDFNGFLIHILKSEAKLGPGHPIFKKYEQVWIENAADGKFSYLVGWYDDIQEAMFALDEDLLRLYPKAQILQYEHGVPK